MPKAKTVSDFVRKRVETIEESASIQQAAAKMKDTKVSSLLVVGRDASGHSTPTGIVTERDIVRKVCANDRRTSIIPIKNIESYPLITIGAKASPLEAIDKMLEENVRHLLVVVNNNKNNLKDKPIGIITPLDLVKYSIDAHAKEKDSNIIEKIYHILEYYR